MTSATSGLSVNFDNCSLLPFFPGKLLTQKPRNPIRFLRSMRNNEGEKLEYCTPRAIFSWPHTEWNLHFRVALFCQILHNEHETFKES